MATDITSGELGIIDIKHKKVHAGKAFAGSYLQTVAANTTVQCLFRTPSATTEVAHALFNVNATGAGKLYLYESPTISTTAGQTSVTLVSTNRINTASTTQCVYVATPTSTIVTGTLIDQTIITTGYNSGLGDASERNEIILKGATTYLVQFLNGNGALTNDVTMNVYFYQGGAS